MSEYNSILNQDENLRVILVLLEKAEQILSIINLSDNIVKKYNQLKEMTYDKLGLEFLPLIKKNIPSREETGRSDRFDSSSNQQINLENLLWDNINKIRVLNHKKNLIIEFLFDLIEKLKYDNKNCNFGSMNYNSTGLGIGSSTASNNDYKFLISERDNFFQVTLDKIYNSNSSSLVYNKNLDDINFDLKMEEIKLKDFLGKSELNYKQFINNLKNLNNNLNNEYNPLFNFSHDNILKNYERKIEDLKRSHERDILEYRTRFNELRVKFNPELENDFFKLKSEFDELRFIIDKFHEMIAPVYEKYYQKNASWYENEKIDFKYIELEKINFVISLVNKFFNDNKYLIDLVSNLQKEKILLVEERNLPLVSNAVQKNGLLLEISEDYKNLENNSNKLYDNFKELIKF